MAQREENAIILDFLPNGYPFDKRPMHRKDSIAQAIGKDTLVLLELVPKKEFFLQPHEEVYIGQGKREKIHHITGRIKPSKLTETAKSELDFILKELIKSKEKEIMNFFNTVGAVNTRLHKLELLPGVGKRHMMEIINARNEKEFESFDDMKARVKLIPDPAKLIMRRILKELEGTEKHLLFVKA